MPLSPQKQAEIAELDLKILMLFKERAKAKLAWNQGLTTQDVTFYCGAKTNKEARRIRSRIQELRKQDLLAWDPHTRVWIYSRVEK